jgi:DHA1 family bicyclomycin/chloramphenicol resistance-like MFS transporter
MLVMFANAAVMANSAAGALSIHPSAAGTASGAMGFLQMGIGALTSQLGAWLGGHFASTLPLTSAIAVMSLACVSTMIFLVPRRKTVVSKAMIAEAEEDEAGVM